MRALLDTHFLLWLVVGSRRLEEFSWLDRYRPWGVSPVSLLETQFLAEAGRIQVQNPEFSESVAADARFVVDEIPLTALVRNAIPLDWTPDPFDRLLSAHSNARRVALCTVDETIQEHHVLIVDELKRSRPA